MVQLNSQKTTQIGFATAIVCFLSNLSQLPFLVNLNLSSTISILIWIFFTVYVLLYNGTLKVSREFLPFFIIMLAYLAYVCGAEILSGKKYLNSAIIYPFILSMFIFCLSNNFGSKITQKDISNMFNAYFLSALIVGLNIFFVFLINADINDRFYAYDSKNSISQILLTAMILGLFYIVPNQNKFRKLLSLCAVLFLALSIMLLKSRATIVSIPFIVLFAFILGSDKDKRIRWKILFLVLLVVVYFLLKPQVFESLVDNIIYGGRDSDSLDDISSGRWSEWQNFIKDLGDGWLFGNGRMKRESLILTSILEYGIPLGLTIIGVAVSPLRFAVRNLKRKNEIVIVLFYVALCYFINSVFEQLAPFGPGVKCYFLWMLFGILISNKNNLAVSVQGGKNEKNDE